jgi:hypothetical protein
MHAGGVVHLVHRIMVGGYSCETAAAAVAWNELAANQIHLSLN